MDTKTLASDIRLYSILTGSSLSLIRTRAIGKNDIFIYYQFRFHLKFRVGEGSLVDFKKCRLDSILNKMKKLRDSGPCVGDQDEMCREEIDRTVTHLNPQAEGVEKFFF